METEAKRFATRLSLPRRVLHLRTPSQPPIMMTMTYVALAVPVVHPPFGGPFVPFDRNIPVPPGHHHANPSILPDDGREDHWRVLCTGIHNGHRASAVIEAVKSLAHYDGAQAKIIATDSSTKMKMKKPTGKNNKTATARYWWQVERCEHLIHTAEAKRAFLQHHISVLPDYYYGVSNTDQREGVRKELRNLLSIAQREGEEMAAQPREPSESPCTLR